ncbi:hypothetical protein GCM10011348_23950 [Marinobacterium nitratireducens]|uniref:Uncharacterized protein n=1 Tax=Marinobacterium nitratireducens TaxID=518897 RepID=A0A917ZG56_9GAMM|nr:hypothetical protein GCM10011348_23950 [Marinobacterium nitratireducens]
MNQKEEAVPDPARAALEQQLMQDPRFPARPVWWHEGTVLAVGMINDGGVKDKAAEDVCQLLHQQGLNNTSVEVYDLLKIQQDDDWNLIGKASCR